MKAKFLIFVVLILGAISIANAQEVRGVETKVVCVYDCPDDEDNKSWSRDESVYWNSTYEFTQNHHTEKYRESNSGNYYYYHIYPGVAFEFTNLNSISISVDAELYTAKGELIDSKSFVLKSKESYIWKRGAIGIDVRDKENYYVKYKAYKLL
jgi:hypothetical protein